MLGSRRNHLLDSSPILCHTILVLISGCLASLSQAQEQSPRSVSIRGTVVNSVTHEPIARAQVYSPDNSFAAMTDDQGHFEVAFPQTTDTGTVSKLNGSLLMARKPGFLPDRDFPGQNPRLTAIAAGLTIPLFPEAILMGRIALDSSDTPDGVQVQLFQKEVRDGLAHWAPTEIAATNSKGEFRFAELYPGDYRLGTHEVGDRDAADIISGRTIYAYPPVYFPASSDFSSASTIHLSPGRVFEADVSLARRQYYPVKISVSNGPVAGMPINVNVSLRGDGAPGYALGYNAFDGTIRGALPNGTYVVEASTFTQQSATGMMTLRVANAPAESGRLTLLPDGVIPVHVTEEFNSPEVPQQYDRVISGNRAGRTYLRERHQYLNVMLNPVSDFGQGRGASLRPPRGPNDESLAIENVRPGRYWVQVNSSKGYAASVTSGGLDLLRKPLVAGPGGSSSPIEITMRDDTASFDGNIEGANSSIDVLGQSASGSSAPFAYVYCIPLGDSPGQFTQIWVAPDGKFESPQIPPGEYRVLAFSHQRNDLEFRDAEAMRAYESKGVLVSLVAGQKEHLQLQLISKTAENAD